MLAAFWPEELEIIGAIDVFGKPGQGQLLRLYGVIPVHRGDYDRSLFTKLISILNAGRPLLIAPEGARSHDTAMRRAKPGIAYLVEKTGVPVCRLASWAPRKISGSVPNAEKNLCLKCTLVKPITLPPITAKGAEKHEARQQNADLVMSYLAGLLPEEYRGVYAGSAIFSS